MEKEKTAKPIIAGVLMFIAAGGKLMGLFALLAASFYVAVPGFVPYLSFIFFILLLLPLVAVIVLSIIGGVYSLKRRRWNLALTGGIVAILPFSIFGIIATVLVAISKDEFEGTLTNFSHYES